VTPEVVGICRLCGMEKPLTFEHVPPRGAYNRYPRMRPDTTLFFNNLYKGGPAPSMISEPRGAGAYTLCGECNQRCGSRYAQHFIEWSKIWREALDSEPTAQTLQLSVVCMRSRVMRQIIAMMLSASPPWLGLIAKGHLRRFVWSSEVVGLPPEVRVYTALTRSQTQRTMGDQAILRTEERACGSQNIAAQAGVRKRLVLKDHVLYRAVLFRRTFRFAPDRVNTRRIIGECISLI
jgi:hypothetical protein